MSLDEADGAALKTAARCLDLLRDGGDTLATAESLTAGLICATLAGVAGASEVLRGGVAVYATDVKVSVLGLDAELISEYGVISSECARAMATAAVGLFGATWAVSATGVAGPARQENRAVGTAYVAVAGPGVLQVRQLALPGDRDRIRRACLTEALGLLASTATGHRRHQRGT